MEIILIDSDKDFSLEFKMFCEKTLSNVDLTIFNDANTFIEHILQNTQIIDGIFINTSLHNDDGILIITSLYNKIKNIPVIFISDNPIKDCQNIFLSTAFFKPFGFLVKPININILEKLLKQLYEMQSLTKSQIKIKISPKKTLLLYSESIIFAESNKRKLTIHTNDNEYCIYEKLKILQEMLPPYFLMPHSSFLINCKYIKSYDNKNVSLLNGNLIPISKKFKRDFFKALDNIELMPIKWES